MIFIRFKKLFQFLGDFSQKSKVPKNYSFEKIIIDFFLKIEQLISNIIYIILIV